MSPSPELEDVTENPLRTTPLISHQHLKNMGILEADYSVIEDGEKKPPGIIKGFLKNKFTQAAAVGFLTSAGLKLAFSTSVRALDVTGCASALTGGTFSAASEIRKDFKEARKDLSRIQAWKYITAQHKWKYTQKFAKGAVVGLVGAGLADVALDYTGVVGNALKEWTQPVRNYTSGIIAKTGIGAWFSEKWTDIKNEFSLKKIGAWFSERWADIKNVLPPKPVPWVKVTPLESAQLRPFPQLATENGGLVSLPPIEEAREATIEPQVPVSEQTAIIEQTSPTTEITVPDPLTPKQQLAGLLDISTPGSDMDKAVYNALQGKTGGMKDVIYGLYNGQNGFPKDRTLAATLIQEFTAPLEGKPLAELTRSQQDLLLQLAYMQFNPEHGEFGVEFNPLHSLEIVEKLGRSWPGAPELAPSIPLVEPQEIAKAAEKISCTITENAPDIQPQFEVHCLPDPETLKPGDSINLTFDWNNGVHQNGTMTIGDNAATMSSKDYLKITMLDILKNAKPPSATAQLTPEI